MSYIAKEIKKGIKLHLIETNKFKTNLITVVITMPLLRENVTKDTMIPAVLKRGTKNLKTQEEISKRLEEMYGAEFNCGIEKIGDNHILKFYIETLNDLFLPEEEKQNLAKDGLDLLFDIIFNPELENGSFKKEYVEAEKNNIKLLIESKIDNKNLYALNRCIEEMHKDKPYGLYKFGYTKDLKDINPNNLYDHYKHVINSSKIDIFFSGDINNENIENYVINNENIKNLQERDAKIIINSTQKIENRKPKVIEEKMDIAQGKLVLGLEVESKGPESRFPISVYNVILRRKCYF